MWDNSNHNNNDEPFSVCKKQAQQAILNCNNAGKTLYSDLPVTAQAYHKRLTYLPYRLDTTGDINIMLASVYN